MNNRYVLFISLISCVAIGYILGDDGCTPFPVQNIELDANSVLHWTPHVNESCTINYYLVQIHNGLSVDYIYHISSTSLSLNFLPVCDSFRFLISAVSSDDITGIERVHFAKMPLPADANLTVGLVMVSEHEEGVFLRWVMDDEWEQCADRFRIIIYDEDDDTVVDQYTRESEINITDLRPCTLYSFGVVALYNIELEGPITVVQRRIEGSALEPPTLQAIQAGTTTVDLTWKLEEFKRNRCEVKSIQISSSGFNVAQNIQDAPSRLPVSVHLNNLRPSSLYLVNVTVINEAGTSSPVILAFQTQDS